MNEPAPQRLAERDDALAALLQRAAEQYADGLDANRALQRLRAKRPSTRFRGSWLLASSALVALVGLLILLPRPRAGGVEGALTAERLGRKPAARSESAGVVVPSASTLPTLLAAPAEPSVRAGARVEPRRPAPKLEVSAAPEPSEPPVVEPDCSALSRAGDAKAAAACFRERAAGSGLSAQIALYELSRLERDALGQPAQALATLERYLERFPNGSLDGEARFSRLELLARLGRGQEALDASREFLSSSFGVERASEVRLLRGNLLLRQGQAAAAVIEYRAASNAPGRIGDDAAYQLAVALERAGDEPRARAAYARYLERPSARHGAAAKARLAALAP